VPQPLIQRLLRLAMRLLFRPVNGAWVPLPMQRRLAAAVGTLVRVPEGGTVERLDAGSVPMLRVRHGHPTVGAAERPALLWAHGGGFVIGLRRQHTALAMALSRALGADVYVPDYRLAPEDPFPAPGDDVFAAYRGMLAQGHDPARVAVGGDSAGGALAVSLALAARDMDVPRPTALVLLSPFVDLGTSGSSYETRRRVDPVLTPDRCRRAARAHAGTLALTDPRVSPLYAELSGLPETLIQVGEDEILLDDSTRLADRIWAGGTQVELQRFPGLWHCFQFHAGTLRASDEAIADIAAFLRRHWAAAEPG
jgi:acetyl esterase/lipase